MFFWIAAAARRPPDPRKPSPDHPGVPRQPPGPGGGRGAGPGSTGLALGWLHGPDSTSRIEADRGRGAGGENPRKSCFFQLSRSLRHLVGFLRYREHCGAAGMYFMIKINIFNERLAAGRGWIIKNHQKSSKINENHDFFEFLDLSGLWSDLYSPGRIVELVETFLR